MTNHAKIGYGIVERVTGYRLLTGSCRIIHGKMSVWQLFLMKYLIYLLRIEVEKDLKINNHNEYNHTIILFLIMKEHFGACTSPTTRNGECNKYQLFIVEINLLVRTRYLVRRGRVSFFIFPESVDKQLLPYTFLKLYTE